MAAPAEGGAAGRAAEPATLVVRVESAFALEMQHLGRAIIERVNAHSAGAASASCAAAGPGGAARAPRPLPRGDARCPGARAVSAEALGGVGDDGLRGALERLGREVLARRPVTGA